LLVVAGVNAPNAYAEVDESPTPPPTGYRDNLIEGGALAVEESEEDFEPSNPAGWPRLIRLEGVYSWLQNGNRQEAESGLIAFGQLDTPQYGALSIDANLGSDGRSFTLWQRALPFDGGWMANNGLGVLTAPSPGIVLRQPRFVLPIPYFFGVSTEWSSRQGISVAAAVGEPGTYSGIRVLEFQGRDGLVASASAQLAIDRQWTAAVQYMGARDVSLPWMTLAPDVRISSNTALAALSWRGAQGKAQLNLVDSQVDGQSNRAGAWFDAEFFEGRRTHGFGAFWLEPGLMWGSELMTGDLAGAYYRLNYRDRQWQVDGGIDLTAPVESAGEPTIYATGSARYQASRDLGVGAALNVRHSGTLAWSGLGYVDRRHAIGISRIQFDAAHAQRDDVTSLQLTFDQSWDTLRDVRLGTSAFVGRIESVLGSTTRYGVAIYGGGDLTSELSIDANLRWSQGVGVDRGDGFSGNVALNWRINSHWTLTSSFYDSRTTTWTPPIVESPIVPPSWSSQKQNDRGFFLSLRYQTSAGSYSVPLGGKPGMGGGKIAGRLYLDANENGRQDAGEDVVANASIMLNERFVARTDLTGRFEFPFVAPGRNVITVLPDNLPLPWQVEAEGRREVELRVRDDVFLDISATRMR
jgi:hypothetical protein